MYKTVFVWLAECEHLEYPLGQLTAIAEIDIAESMIITTAKENT